MNLSEAIYNKAYDLRKGKVKEIEVDETVVYYNKSDIIYKYGYKNTGVEVYYNGHICDIYEKEGKYYILKSIEHFNTEVYSFKVKEIIIEESNKNGKSNK